MDAGVYIILWCGIGGMVGLAIGQSKGRGAEGFALGLFLGIIGWLLVLTGPDTRRKCQECLGAVPDGAKKCQHCGSELKVMAKASPKYDMAKPFIAHGTISFRCPSCNEPLRVPADMRGLPVTCQTCKEWVNVP